MAHEEILPGDDHDDGVLDDDEVIREFFGIVLNIDGQPDREADEQFLGEMLLKLRAEGKHKYAAALIADFVQKHGAPLRWDGEQ
ncbi:hypothetical protein ACTWP6_06245 [Mycobacterium sp. 4D054]|uniref:hypothetical protein n=1 Tax=Mycobacterium sp. 4D054 TaxID=3457440 RepID=UPI003FD6B588